MGKNFYGKSNFAVEQIVSFGKMEKEKGVVRVREREKAKQKKFNLTSYRLSFLLRQTTCTYK